MTLYAVYRKDLKRYLLEMDYSGFTYKPAYSAILCFTSKRRACKAGAIYYGFETYTEAKRKDWIEVRKIS